MKVFMLNKDKNLELKGKVALINGLSSDIGLQIGKILQLNDVIIYGTYCTNKSASKSLLTKYKTDDHLYQIDFTKDNYELKIKDMVENIFKRHKRIDMLINVSGIQIMKPFLYETKEDRKNIFLINYESVVNFCHYCLKKMIISRGGDIINIASTAGVRGSGQLAQYAASKAAVINLTKSLAEEFGPRNVKVNSISPGTTDTKAIDKNIDFVGKELLTKNIPRTRLCTSEDIANTVIGILTNDYITGENIVLHGGKL